MAIDTRDKRASVFAVGLGLLLVGPTPDGAIDSAADRLHVAGLYRGPLAAGASEPIGRLEIRDLARVHVRDLARVSVGDEHRVSLREETR